MTRFGVTYRIIFQLCAVVLFSQVAQANDVLQAARTGDVEALTIALEAEGGADPSGLSHPLFFAAQSGHTEVVAVLLDYGADPNTKFDFGTPLQKAARSNHSGIVELLLVAGAEPDTAAGDKSYTPLHDAAERGSLEAAELLVAHGADVNARGQYGVPPIHLAARKGKVEVFEFLSKNGAHAIEPPPISAGDLAAADQELGRITAIGCTQCHIVVAGATPSGAHNHGLPLMGVVGRQIASVNDYAYSSAMKAIQGIWTIEELNRFIADPPGRVPGTTMGLLPELSDIERVALIAYLNGL